MKRGLLTLLHIYHIPVCTCSACSYADLYFFGVSPPVALF